MSDFVLHYDVLEGIAKTSNSLGRQADEYANSLTSRIANAITSVTGPSSGYLEDASYYINEKVARLQMKAQEFFDFAEQVTVLAETATRVDAEVQKLLAENQAEFLAHHESLRIDDWKADILNWLVGIKNKLPFLEVLGNILSAVDTILESFVDSIKYWYQCEGGKYLIELVGGIVRAVIIVTLFVVVLLALPASIVAATTAFSVFSIICGAIGAGIAAVNALTNVATSFRAAYTACNGDPTWARIYSKQNTLSQVLRETNFNNGILNSLSYLGADVIDTTEFICFIVGIVQIGKSIINLSKKLFNNINIRSFKPGNFKASIKANFTEFKVNIKKGFTDLKANVKQGDSNLKSNIKSGFIGNLDDLDDFVDLNKLDDVKPNVLDNVLPESVVDTLEGGIKTKLDYVTSNGLELEATPGRTTTVLGTYKSDTGAILDELGNVKSLDFGSRDGSFNLLNTPDELYVSPKQFWNEYNKQWLDNVIARDDIVKIATEPTWDNLTRINRVTGKTELTGFGREYTYLKQHGYKYDAITKIMNRELK